MIAVRPACDGYRRCLCQESSYGPFDCSGRKKTGAAQKKDGATLPPAEAEPWPPPCAHCGGTRVVFLGLTLPGGTVVAGHALAAAGPVCAASVRVPP